MQQKGLSALVFGATGATGAELVSILLKSNKWAKVHCIVRRQLDEWKDIIGRQKLVIQLHQDLDEYFKQLNDKYGHINSVFCCFGVQTKFGEELFIKIDKTYPLQVADIVLRNNIRHYLVVSSTGANQDSCFFYLKVKGELQRDLKLKKLPILSIFKPGLLKNRRNARFGEQLGGWLPCFPSIDAIEASQVFSIVAQRAYERNVQQNGVIQVYENADMLQIIAQKPK